MKTCTNCQNNYDNKTFTHACPYCGVKAKGQSKLKTINFDKIK